MQISKGMKENHRIQGMLCATQVIMEEFMLELDKITSMNGFEWGMALVVEISSRLKSIFRGKKLFG
jgi:hypothetical protein